MADIQFVNFACENPKELADFWAAAIDGERRDLPPEAEVIVVDGPDDGPGLMFREGPRGTDRDLPIHLDLGAENREATVERLEELGATVRETRTLTEGDHELVWTVLEDPAGNGFCVSEYAE